MTPLTQKTQTPYHLLAIAAATSILKTYYLNENDLVNNRIWVNLTDNDYVIKSICWLEEGYQAEIVFKTTEVDKTIIVPFQTVTLHQFISYIAVKQALEKPHAKLFTHTYLRRAGNDIDCVVPHGHNFNEGFHHNDWYFPPEMFIVKNDTLVFHSPLIQGMARIIYYAL